MPPERPIRPGVRLLALTTLAIGVLAAGCGGSSPHPAAATAGVRDARSSGATRGATNSGSTTSGTGAASELAFARCMRANGVPNFPDPSPGGGFVFNTAGLDPAAPAFQAAHAKCNQLLPAGGPPAPGTHTRPSAKTLIRLLGIARCMRAHGVSQFPDPGTSVPSDFGPGNYRGVTDFDGAILAWPTTLDMQSPAYTRAAAECGPLAQKLGLSHPH